MHTFTVREISLANPLAGVQRMRRSLEATEDDLVDL